MEFEMTEETLRWLSSTAITIALDLLSNAVTVAMALVGFYVLFRQIQRQHESSLQLQRSNQRDSLHITLFHQIIEKVDKAGASIVLAEAKATSIMLAFRMQKAIPGFEPPLPSQ